MDFFADLMGNALPVNEESGNQTMLRAQQGWPCHKTTVHIHTLNMTPLSSMLHGMHTYFPVSFF